MKYFDIPTIRTAIEHLQEYSANWLLPAFVFAANDIGADGLVDMSKRLGTDRFLDRYFNGELLELPAKPRGNNLLRPRFNDIKWKNGPFANDYIIQQDTKMWGNLFSSRGYREMKQQGYIQGEKAIVSLTNTFEAQFEVQVPETFRFEYFMVWLFAFRGFPEAVSSWTELFQHLLKNEFKLEHFKEPYLGRFRVADPPEAWPTTLSKRSANKEIIEALAPKLAIFLAEGGATKESGALGENELESLADDDSVYVTVKTAIALKESYAFLFAGPPGTGKSRYARRLAAKLTDAEQSKVLFLQFHPALGYDDFVEGFRPVKSDNESGISYELAPRLFLKFANEARMDDQHTYVAVIDEVNRGDVARIFGEVLTYLEPNYRGKEFTLAYSGDVVTLPSNLVLIATANPYDRSVTDLDDALLRRFWVIELEPDATILRAHLQEKAVDDALVNRIVQLFTIVDRAMPNGFGHTNFLRIQTIDDLVAVWIGRVRMGLRRALMHDRPTYESTVAEIEALLSTSEDSAEEGEDSASDA